MLRVLRCIIVASLQTAARRLRRGPLRPTWSFAFELVHRYLRVDWEETEGWELARLRDDMARRPYPKKYAPRAIARDEELGGSPTRAYAPQSITRDGAILFLHGGSFIFGSAKTTHAELLARLALESGAEVYGVDYRLAPEHPYPAQLDDAVAAFDALVERGIAPAQIVLAGDSAGGNLALAAELVLRDRGGARPKALALLSPWCDLAMNTDSYQANAALDFGTRAALVRHAAAYAGGIALSDARVSPVHARLDGLPPTFVSFGACELLRDDALGLVAKLRDEGVAVTTHEAEDMPHNPALFAELHPSARASFEALVAFVRAQLA